MTASILSGCIPSKFISSTHQETIISIKGNVKVSKWPVQSDKVSRRLTMAVRLIWWYPSGIVKMLRGATCDLNETANSIAKFICIIYIIILSTGLTYSIDFVF
jgi:hypothetical protein